MLRHLAALAAAAAAAALAGAGAVAASTRHIYMATNSTVILAYSLTWSSDDVPSVSLTYNGNISVSNPQYTVLHPTLPVLYSIERGATYSPADWPLSSSVTNNAGNLTTLYNATLSGGLAAVSLDSTSRLPTSVLSRVPSLGVSPDFVGILGASPVIAAEPQPIDYAANVPLFLATTTYSTGSASVFRLNTTTGAIIWPPTSVFFLPPGEYVASGNSRQSLATAHHFVQKPVAQSGQRVDTFVTNLGTDRVFEFSLSLKTGVLTEAANQVVVPLGSGPRHVTFHPFYHPYAYLISEVGSTLTVFNYDTLQIVQTISTLSGFNGTNTAGEVVVHPNGNFLFASNRGEDSVAVFAISNFGATLTKVGSYSSGGAFPRYITLVNLDEATWPSARFCDPGEEPRFVLLVTNHNTPNFVAFS
ncbi:hypothetical protein HK405_012068, partial [Cladochytrium tenue]